MNDGIAISHESLLSVESLLFCCSLETVMYLNLRIGRESLNHHVLSSDLMNDGSASSSLFQSNIDAGITMDFSAPPKMTDYRHVPLMDRDEQMIGGTEMI